jgi:mRNA-degrading endonuclease RelE of RelBE toxin-antitoxin system
LKEDLMKYVRVNISETVMKQSLGKYVKNGNNPIAGLSEFIRSREGKSLRQRLQSGEKIRLGNSRIVFDWDDLSDNKRKNGITGLGWYVKNGFLTTKFAGMYGSLINFTGAKLKSDPESPEQKEKTPKVS